MTISNPKVNIEIIPAFQKEQNEAQKILFIGQKVAAGTATAGVLEESIGNDNSEDTLFGENSMLAGMIRDAKAINKVTRIDAIALDDSGTGVPATGEIALTGTASEAGVYTVIIGSSVNHSYTITVADLDTADDVGAAIETAVNADTSVPVTASNSSGAVTMTADNDGTVGNFITLKITGSVAGLTPSVTGMSSGANDPVLTNVFDVVGDIRYQTIVWPYADLTEVTSFLDDRWSVDNFILDGVAIYTLTDTLANLKIAANAENTQSLMILSNKVVNENIL